MEGGEDSSKCFSRCSPQVILFPACLQPDSPSLTERMTKELNYQSTSCQSSCVCLKIKKAKAVGILQDSTLHRSYTERNDLVHLYYYLKISNN